MFSTIRLPELEAQFGLDPTLLADKGPHILASIGVMAVPGLIAWGSDTLMRTAFGSSNTTPTAPAVVGADAPVVTSVAVSAPITPFLELSYGYLPLVWGGTLAHYLQQFLEEAGNILPVTAATFGMDGSRLPVLAADHAVTEFLQVCCCSGAQFTVAVCSKSPST